MGKEGGEGGRKKKGKEEEKAERRNGEACVSTGLRVEASQLTDQLRHRELPCFSFPFYFTLVINF